MSDQTDAPAADLPEPEEWQPEPRKWEWRDLFTAPMLAFKPKCMVISAVTIALVGAFIYGWGFVGAKCQNIIVLNTALIAVGAVIAAAIYGVGASLVATFMKADLLDDEFLSLGEALGQWGKRLKAAVLVPAFLVGVVVGFYVLLYVGMLICHVIPFVGGIIYAVLYPLAYIVALLGVFVAICVCFSFFIFPAIVAIRKHGWFDNVIDTLEAVVTKPSVVFLNIVIVILFILFSFGICQKSGCLLTNMAAKDPNLPGYEVARTEYHATKMKAKIFGVPEELKAVNPGLMTPADKQHAHADKAMDKLHREQIEAARAKREAAIENWKMQRDEALAEGKEFTLERPEDFEESEVADPRDSMIHKVSGAIAGVIQVIIAILVLGYLVNLYLAGGMLTYLAVREEDYWDDEDMEDLDALAKELEAEAKAEAEKLAAEAPAAPAEEAPAEEASTEEAEDAGEAEEAEDAGEAEEAEEGDKED